PVDALVGRLMNSARKLKHGLLYRQGVGNELYILLHVIDQTKSKKLRSESVGSDPKSHGARRCADQPYQGTLGEAGDGRCWH
ncbi:hypothetical protein, partial [Pseudomonas aeruginosa]|uniref:hypothetical protein n=1 Tax=Pseudomonas aeruginosa TaxID=287 RepID=UPI001ABC5ECE